MQNQNVNELLSYINELEELLTSPQKQKIQPKTIGCIKINDLNSVLYNKTKCRNIFISDNVFNTCSIEECVKYLENFKNNNYYQKESFDCDNFSIALKNYWNEPNTNFPLGIAWSLDHAFNIFVDYENTIWLIEPQDKSYFKINEKLLFTKDAHYTPIQFILV